MVGVKDMVNLAEYEGKYHTFHELSNHLKCSSKTLYEMMQEQGFTWLDLKKQKKNKNCLSCQKKFKSKGEWFCVKCRNYNKEILNDVSLGFKELLKQRYENE